MAPEQLEGLNADARSDVFAFGAVVYEMVTGTKAFAGESQASLIGAILKDEPQPIGALQPVSPPSMDRVVRKCLAKNPDRRWQDAGDLRDELQWIAEADTRAGAPAIVATSSRARERLLWTMGIATAAVVATVLVWTLRPALPPSPVDHVTVTLPPDVSVPDRFGTLALSPDGREVVFVGERDGALQLYHRALGQRDAAPLPDTEGATAPLFSPDGRWVAFRAEGTLRKIPVAGGDPVEICDLPPGTGGSAWGPDNRIWIAGLYTGLYSVSADGGVPQVVTTPSEQETGHWVPHPLPDGRGVVFTLFLSDNVSGARVAVYSDESGEYDVLGEGLGAQYASSGHLVFQDPDGEISALAFDLDTFEAKGDPVRVFAGVRVVGAFRVAQYSLGDGGSLVYVPSTGGENRRSLVWVDRAGNEERLEFEPAAYGNPRVSPDGRRFAVENHSDRDIWILDLSRNIRTRLTRNPAQDIALVDAIRGPDRFLIHP